MRILSVALQGPNSTSIQRTAAMRRLGHDVVVLDIEPLLGGASRLANWLRIRTLVGATVARINRAVLSSAAAERPDLVWFDKPTWIRAQTVRALTASGVAVVSFMPDNPFGPRRDPGWRLFRASIPHYSAHVVCNRVTMDDYRAAGAAHVFFMPFAFDPVRHYAPPPGWGEANRDIDVAFIGTPYDDRAGFLRRLADMHGIRVRIWGEPHQWRRVYDDATMARLHAGQAAYNDAYRELIWRSRVSLGFVTHSNLDTIAHRWFEIAACGGFLLAERTPDGPDYFADGREAVFFNGIEDCADAIRRYLSDPAAREAIARAGHARAIASGYDYDSRLRTVFAELARALPALDVARSGAAARP